LRPAYFTSYRRNESASNHGHRTYSCNCNARTLGHCNPALLGTGLDAPAPDLRRIPAHLAHREDGQRYFKVTIRPRQGQLNPFSMMKVISLCPSLTELVFDLGRGDALIGRTKFCVHPHDRVRDVPSMGGTKNPRVERIIALQPDLVLMNEEENRLEDAESLREAGVRCLTSLPRTTSDTADMVREIASALDAGTEGERIAHDIETRAERVAVAARDRNPVRYAYLIWHQPLMTLNDDTFVSAMLALPGGVNVFGQLPDRYPAIAEAQPGTAEPRSDAA